MKLYKAESPKAKNQYVEGMSYFSFSPDSAIQWGKILFGNTPFYIREYKIPDHLPALYNTGTYRFDPSRWEWTGGEGSTVLQPLKVIAAMHLPITGQVLVQTGNLSQWEYRQIAYFDGQKLFTKNKREEDYLSLANTLASISSMIERVDVAMGTLLTFFHDAENDGSIRSAYIDLKQMQKFLHEQYLEGLDFLKEMKNFWMVKETDLNTFEDAFSAMLKIVRTLSDQLLTLKEKGEKQNNEITPEIQKIMEQCQQLCQAWTETMEDYTPALHVIYLTLSNMGYIKTIPFL